MPTPHRLTKHHLSPALPKPLSPKPLHDPPSPPLLLLHKLRPSLFALGGLEDDAGADRGVVRIEGCEDGGGGREGLGGEERVEEVGKEGGGMRGGDRFVVDGVEDEDGGADRLQEGQGGWMG
mgnify:CR=1 FL=1